MIDKIAETKLIGVDTNGHQARLVLRIGKPYPINAKTWACAVEADGLIPRMEDVQGYDSFQTIMLAVRALRGLLMSFIADGGKVLWSDNGKEVDIEELFPILSC